MHIKLLGHGTIILAGMFIVLNLVDSINPAMNFLTSELSKGLLWMLSICAIACAIKLLCIYARRDHSA